MSPLYPGQGLSLPAEAGINGEWVIENQIFLFQTHPPKALGEFFGLHHSDGTEADGFDADILAEHLEIDTPSLLFFNQSHSLRVTIQSIPTRPGADQSFRATFQTPNNGVAITFSRAAIQGRA